ncbi:MAG: pentapeptide repeat-containing protein [Leptolyngbya sp. SIO4C1]|nr:pentapeptide repeat-containing protein [Leptolyngbya sp. SIO4C1]
MKDALSFRKKHRAHWGLSSLAAEFIRKSSRQKRLGQLALSSLIIIPLISVEAFIRELNVRQNYADLYSDNPGTVRQAALSLVEGCSQIETRQWHNFWPSIYLNPLKLIAERIFGNCRSLANQSLDGAQLQNAEMSRANLFRANLAGADLSRISLFNANLVGINFTEANLDTAGLAGADLAIANFSKANLRYTSFEDADLRETDFTDTDLSQAFFSTEAQLGEAILCRTVLPENISFDPNRDCDE